MSIATESKVPQSRAAIPRLEPGDKLDQATFHERYEAMPGGTRAELIGGIVHMPSPMKMPHGKHQHRVSWWLSEYEYYTPGVTGGAGATAILGDEDEPQPDACLFILPEKGGQTLINDEDYLEGAPELIVEIASSTESIDLHRKKASYERAGVREYVVIAIRQHRLFWFVLRNGAYQELAPADDGTLRSEVFPGLWLHPQAMLDLNDQLLRETTKAGLASPEHAAFVAKMK